MTILKAWLSFPLTYRAQEMQILAHWILAGEGGSVVGLPGCGRANLLGFLCHRPEAIQSYLPPDTSPTVPILVDLNNLPVNDLPTLYRLILRSFHWVREHFEPEIRESVAALYHETKAAQDPFLSQSALYEVLFAFQARQTRVTLVLNRFDRFCQEATPQMLNTLRGLRDSFKETLCFIAGMPKEVVYVPDHAALGDMYELLDSNVCWVGAMTEPDARYVIAQATTTAARAPIELEIAAMLSLAGNFPVLLKAIGYWWLDNKQLPINEWRSVLAANREIRHRLKRMWKGLSGEEQSVLSELQAWQGAMTETEKQALNCGEALDVLQDHSTTLARLAVKGMCEQTDTGRQILGELLADYVMQIDSPSGGRICLDEKTKEIRQGKTLLRDLAPLEKKLLHKLIKQPYEPIPYSDLSDELWPGEARDDQGERIVDRKGNLQRVVRDLRQKIETKPSEPRYIINWRGRPEGGYQFYPEGRPG